MGTHQEPTGKSSGQPSNNDGKFSQVYGRIVKKLGANILMAFGVQHTVKEALKKENFVAQLDKKYDEIIGKVYKKRQGYKNESDIPAQYGMIGNIPLKVLAYRKTHLYPYILLKRRQLTNYYVLDPLLGIGRGTLKFMLSFMKGTFKGIVWLFKKTFKGLWALGKNIVKGIFTLSKKTFGLIKTGIKKLDKLIGFSESISKGFKAVVGKSGEFFEKIVGKSRQLKDVFVKFINRSWLGKAARGAIGLAKRGIEYAKNFARSVGNKITGAYEKVREKVIGAYKRAQEKAIKFVNKVKSKINNFKSAISNKILPIINKGKDIVGKGIQKVSDFKSSILNKIGSFKEAAIEKSLKAADIAAEAGSKVSDFFKPIKEVGATVIGKTVGFAKGAFNVVAAPVKIAAKGVGLGVKGAKALFGAGKAAFNIASKFTKGFIKASKTVLKKATKLVPGLGALLTTGFELSDLSDWLNQVQAAKENDIIGEDKSSKFKTILYASSAAAVIGELTANAVVASLGAVTMGAGIIASGAAGVIANELTRYGAKKLIASDEELDELNATLEKGSDLIDSGYKIKEPIKVDESMFEDAKKTMKTQVEHLVKDAMDEFLKKHGLKKDVVIPELTVGSSKPATQQKVRVGLTLTNDFDLLNSGCLV